MRDFYQSALLAILLLLIGCRNHRGYEVSEWLRLDRVRFSAQSALVGASADTLLVTVAAANESSHDQTMMISECPPSPVAVSAQRANKTWDSNDWEKSKVPVHYDSAGHVLLLFSTGCSIFATAQVPPRVSMSYDLRMAVRDILGDSLQSGRYKITARLYINQQLIKDLHAGEIELSSAPMSTSSVNTTTPRYRDGSLGGDRSSTLEFGIHRVDQCSVQGA